MLKIKLNSKTSLIIILTLAFLIRVFRLNHPQTHIFDEVYCAFTAQEIAKANPEAWGLWHAAPEGFAYGWSHPYLAKELMAVGVLLFGQSHLAYRLPAVVFGVGVIYLSYLLAKELFGKKIIALTTAWLVAFEGLIFVMSRTGMLDIFLLFFILMTVYLTLSRKYFYSALSLGAAVACKWTGLYLFPVVGVGLLFNFFKENGRTASFRELLIFLVPKAFLYLLIPPAVYLISYLPFFGYGYGWPEFKELQKQMWWYHTSLKASHNHQSPAWSWPFLLRPVWFWVEYKKRTVANIYNLGNPAVFWAGAAVLPYGIYKAVERIKTKNDFSLSFLLFAYFSFWAPWLFSPRIMFLHHYMPAVPFLAILIAWFLEKVRQVGFKISNKKIEGSLVVKTYLGLVLIVFLFFYPLYTGLPVAHWLGRLFFWLPSWR